MAIAHQVVDETSIALVGFGILVCGSCLKRLLTLGRNPGGKENVLVASICAYQFDGYIGSKNYVRHSH
jgi:hypothetical protein